MISSTIKTSLVAALFVFSTGMVAANSQTLEEKGLAIAKEADRVGRGFVDSKSSVTMTLKNRNGEVATRALRAKTLETQSDGDKLLIIFDQPRDVKGTVFLSFSHAAQPDDQWLYLPALKRVKRIASKDKSGSFMGSEFSYEDLSSREVEKFSYKYVRDETLNNAAHFVVEAYPSYSASGYNRQVIWFEKLSYRIGKIEFYSRSNSLLKTLNASNFQQYKSKYWRAGQLKLVNHSSGKETTLDFSDYQFGNGFTARDFNKNSLKRAK